MDGATDSATYCSSMDWESFCYQIAGEKGVKKDCLNLAYKFSTALQKDLPKVLNTPVHFAGLWDGAKAQLVALSKKRETGKVFKCILVDRKEVKKKENSKEKKSVRIHPSLKHSDDDLIKYSVSRLQESEGRVR